MRPVMIHQDGTDCHHDGTPQATAFDETGPLCPGGCPVTHVRFNGQVLTIEQAAAAFMKIVKAFTEAITPLIAAFAELGHRVAADPALRALADRSRATPDR